MATLKKLSEVREALKQPGSKLVKNARFNPYPAFWVEAADGSRVSAGKVADRLTWGGAKAAVKFESRTTLELFYTPK